MAKAGAIFASLGDQGQLSVAVKGNLSVAEMMLALEVVKSQLIAGAMKRQTPWSKGVDQFIDERLKRE
jgi:hypothetical protein